MGKADWVSKYYSDSDKIEKGKKVKATEQTNQMKQNQKAYVDSQPVKIAPIEPPKTNWAELAANQGKKELTYQEKLLNGSKLWDGKTANAPLSLPPKLDNIARNIVSFGLGAANTLTAGTQPLNDKLRNPENYAKQKAVEEYAPKSNIAGKIVGGILPGTVGTKLTAPLVKGIGNTVGRVAAQEGLVGGIMGGTEGLTSGLAEDLRGMDLLKNTAKYTAGGVGAGALLGGAGAGIGKYIKYLKNRPSDSKALKEIDNAYSNLKGDINSQPNVKVPPTVSNKFNSTVKSDFTANDFKGSKSESNISSPVKEIEGLKGQRIEGNATAPITKRFEDIRTVNDLPTDELGLTSFIKQNEELQKKGIKINLQLFAEAQKRLKNRQFVENSILNAEVVPQGMKEQLSKNMPTYEPITNNDTWDAAQERIASNIEDAKDEWRALDFVKSADDTALGQALMVDAIKKGNATEANEIAYQLAEKLTKAGQAVQAASILKRLSPEGMLTYVNRTLQKAEKEAFGKLDGKLKLKDEEVDAIKDAMDKIREMDDGRLKDIEFAKIQKLVSDKIPPTFREKLKALQRVNLLFNPKTMIRNVGGNVIFTALNNIKDTVRSGIDKGVSAITKERTALLPNIKAQGKGLKEGFKTTLEDYNMGIDTTNLPTQFELNTQRTTSPFKSKIFKKADELTRLGLKLGDTPFYRAAYEDSLSQQMKISGAKEATPEMKLFAENVAKERTFQDTNKFTELFDGLRNGLNKVGYKGFGLGDVVLPFTKTPANILKAGVEYSPLNIFKTVGNAVQLAKGGGKEAQYKLVDNLAKTLTGTGLLGAGMLLAQKGLITGKGPEDYDADNFQREQGILPYSFKTESGTVSFDWAQPASIPIAMGADIYNNFKNSKTPDTAIFDGIGGGVGTLFSQSMVQGLQKLFSSYDNEKGLIKNLENAGYNSILQLIPFNVISRQTAELFDGQGRSTYDDSDVKSKLVNKAVQTVPFARNMLPPKVKTTGETQESRAFYNVLFNPANTGTQTMTPAKREIIRLYNETGETIQFPRIADKKLIYKTEDGKETRQLNGSERSKYQEMLGKETMAQFDKLINLSEYINARDEEKAKLLQGVITDSKAKVDKDLKEQLKIKEFIPPPTPKKLKFKF